ncbi:MAG: hypothetical protein CMP52_06805 [Flavobacteriales bacterium]|nr:hypothetical protein [Candidatus Arcticimaribacter sp.]
MLNKIYKVNYKILMFTTFAIIIANFFIEFFTNFWGDSNYPDYFNSILILLLIIFGTKVFFKKK